MKAKNGFDSGTIAELAGERVLEVVDVLKKRKNVSEFKLAELLGKDVNQTRNMLYQLYHLNLVSFTRKKDKEKGWYIYYWTFMPNQLLFLKKRLKIRKIEGLREQIQREQSNFYFACDDKCIRIDIEQATGYDYRCPECGKLLHQQDNREHIKMLEQQIKDLQTERRASAKTVAARRGTV